jgi:hypothetical protein
VSCALCIVSCELLVPCLSSYGLGYIRGWAGLGSGAAI